MSANTPIVEPEQSSKPAKGIALGSLIAVIGQRRSWNLSLLPIVLWHAATNIVSYRKVRRLFKLPAFAEVVRGNPRFPLKFLTQHYLVRGLSVPARAAAFLHHYMRLHTTLPEKVLRQTLREEITLLKLSESGYCFSITLGISQQNDKEGEYSLNFKVDGTTAYLVSFSFVPGWVAGSTADEILLITRLQGIKGCFQQIALATRCLHNCAPDHLLLAALQGMATAMGIGTMGGVTGRRQTCYLDEFADLFQKTYDAFFEETGFLKTESGFFLGEIPLQQKPLASIKRGHKIRTKEKRAFKQQILESCAEYFLTLGSKVSAESAAESPMQRTASLESLRSPKRMTG